MYERSVTVGSPVGLHARPATAFCALAAQQPVAVTVGRPDGPAVDARSIVLVMSLRIKGGETVVLRSADDGAQESVDALAALVASEHDAAV
jgi:phosphocarrier protein HPr